MNKTVMSPSEQAKVLLVDVFKDIAKQSNAQLTEDNIRKIELAVDHIIVETTAS